MVFGRRADHRGPANVDILDAGVIIAALGDGFLERIEVHHQQIDRADAVFLHCRLVIFIVAQRQEATMHHRVQGLDPAIHHLGKAGNLGHIAHREARRAQGLGASAGGK